MAAEALTLRSKGQRAFTEFGIDADALMANWRPLVRPYLDWSERRVHLGGALGAGLFYWFCDLGWLRRDKRTRAVCDTPRGRLGFRQRFDVEV